MRDLFGTDGVRGAANHGALTPAGAALLAQSACKVLAPSTRRPKVVIGKDTRISGYMIETALTAGFASAGVDVELLGPIPTPGVSRLTRSLRADFGVMITASHNPYGDNGVKFFGPEGYKIDDAAEAAIDEAFRTNRPNLVSSRELGRAHRIAGGTERYIEFVKAQAPAGLRLDGLRVVVDAAHGAGWRAAPAALAELGAEVIAMGVDPDGFNINAGVGATSPSACASRVVETRADLGIALDGDGDRLVVIDERGDIADGDQILGLIARRWAQQDRLKSREVVGTVMSNLGLERMLADLGLNLLRTPVGDRNVVARMKQCGSNLGGESSGHIVMLDVASTGDGLAAAIEVMSALVETGGAASRLVRAFSPTPQATLSLRIDRSVLEDPGLRTRIGEIEHDFPKGRIIVRPSGTEPVIRATAEADEQGDVDEMLRRIEDAIASAAA